MDNYIVLYKAKQGVNPKEVRFNVKANDKSDARFKANKESGLGFMYEVLSITEIK